MFIIKKICHEERSVLLVAQTDLVGTKYLTLSAVEKLILLYSKLLYPLL
jgi:hypothetical protein